MWRAACLPWPIADGHACARRAPCRRRRRSPGSRSSCPAPTCTTPSSTSSPGTPSSSDRSASWPSASTSGVGLELLELAGRLREAVVVELHPLHHQRGRRRPRLIVESHRISTPSSIGLLDLEVVRRHPLAGPAVDDDRLLGAEPPGRAGHVHGGVRRRRRRRRGGRAAAAPRPPCDRSSDDRVEHARRLARRGCRRACRCARPTARNAASKPPCAHRRPAGR